MNINYFKNIIYKFIIFITFAILNYFFIDYIVYRINVLGFSLIESTIIIAIIVVFLNYIDVSKQRISELQKKNQDIKSDFNEKNDELENYNQITSKQIAELNQSNENCRDIINQKNIQIKTLTDKHKILKDEKIKLESEIAIYEDRIKILISKKNCKNINNVINTDDNEPELLIKR